MSNAKSSQTEKIRSHKVEVQRESDEATSYDRFLVFFGDRLADEWLETLLNLLGLEKSWSYEVLLAGSVSDEGNNYPIGG